MSTKDLTPTDEQEEIIEATARSADSIMIDAYAGCSKTTTLEMASGKIRGPALALAFNKSIAEELKARFPSNFEVKTMNALGFGALRRARPKVGEWKLDDKKVGRLLTEEAKRCKIELGAEDWDSARRLVSGAQLRGMVANGRWNGEIEAEWTDLAASLWIEPDRQTMALAWDVLRLNNEETEKGIISFDDQVYWPTTHGATFPQYPTILVDEAQDLSPLQHRMLALATGPRSRLLVCGDPRQSIYAFRGADTESMQKMRGLREGWLTRPLTLTFRCPKAIVARQQAHAPGFRAAERNAEGRVVLQEVWDWPLIESFRIENGSLAVLCRNNAPLFSLAFKLLRRGIGVVMLGRDIGKGLKALVKKIGGEKNNLTIVPFLAKLNVWRNRESELAMLNGREAQAESIHDRAECLQAIAEGSMADDMEGLCAAIEKIFAREKGTVVLTSIHKAKGLEWDTVVHLDPWRIPSGFAKRAAAKGDMKALGQEWNLKYVAETRSKHTLVEVEMKGFER